MDLLFTNSGVRLRAVLILAFFLLFQITYSQNRISLDTINNTVYIGEFKLKTPESIVSKYIYDQELNFLKTWIADRMEWLKQEMSEL